MYRTRTPTRLRLFVLTHVAAATCFLCSCMWTATAIAEQVVGSADEETPPAARADSYTTRQLKMRMWTHLYVRQGTEKDPLQRWAQYDSQAWVNNLMGLLVSVIPRPGSFFSSAVVAFPGEGQPEAAGKNFDDAGSGGRGGQRTEGQQPEEHSGSYADADAATARNRAERVGFVDIHNPSIKATNRSACGLDSLERVLLHEIAFRYGIELPHDLGATHDKADDLKHYYEQLQVYTSSHGFTLPAIEDVLKKKGFLGAMERDELRDHENDHHHSQGQEVDEEALEAQSRGAPSAVPAPDSASFHARVRLLASFVWNDESGHGYREWASSRVGGEDGLPPAGTPSSVHDAFFPMELLAYYFLSVNAYRGVATANAFTKPETRLDAPTPAWLGGVVLAEMDRFSGRVAERAARGTTTRTEGAAIGNAAAARTTTLFICRLMQSFWPVFGVLDRAPWNVVPAQLGDQTVRVHQHVEDAQMRNVLQPLETVVQQLEGQPWSRVLAQPGYRVPAWVAEGIEKSVALLGIGSKATQVGSRDFVFFRRLARPQVVAAQTGEANAQQLLATTEINLRFFHLLARVEYLLFFKSTCPTYGHLVQAEGFVHESLSADANAVFVLCVPQIDTMPSMVGHHWAHMGAWPDNKALFALAQKHKFRELRAEQDAAGAADVYSVEKFLQDMGKHEQQQQRAQSRHLNTTHPEAIVDVGANIGSVSIYFAVRGYQVLAIEPLPANIRFLRGSIAANKLENVVHVAEVAASSPPSSTDENARKMLFLEDPRDNGIGLLLEKSLHDSHYTNVTYDAQQDVYRRIQEWRVEDFANAQVMGDNKQQLEGHQGQEEEHQQLSRADAEKLVAELQSGVRERLNPFERPVKVHTSVQVDTLDNVVAEWLREVDVVQKSPGDINLAQPLRDHTVVHPRIRLVKIDAEGQDVAVLAGSQKLMQGEFSRPGSYAGAPPVMFVENNIINAQVKRRTSPGKHTKRLFEALGGAGSGSRRVLAEDFGGYEMDKVARGPDAVAADTDAGGPRGNLRDESTQLGKVESWFEKMMTKTPISKTIDLEVKASVNRPATPFVHVDTVVALDCSWNEPQTQGGGILTAQANEDAALGANLTSSSPRTTRAGEDSDPLLLLSAADEESDKIKSPTTGHAVAIAACADKCFPGGVVAIPSGARSSEVPPPCQCFQVNFPRDYPQAAATCSLYSRCDTELRSSTRRTDSESESTFDVHADAGRNDGDAEEASFLKAGELELNKHTHEQVEEGRGESRVTDHANRNDVEAVRYPGGEWRVKRDAAKYDKLHALWDPVMPHLDCPLVSLPAGKDVRDLLAPHFADHTYNSDRNESKGGRIRTVAGTLGGDLVIWLSSS